MLERILWLSSESVAFAVEGIARCARENLRAKSGQLNQLAGETASYHCCVQHWILERCKVAISAVQTNSKRVKL